MTISKGFLQILDRSRNSILGRWLRGPLSRLIWANLEPSIPSADLKPSTGHLRVVEPLVAGQSTIEPACTHQVNRCLKKIPEPLLQLASGSSLERTCTRRRKTSLSLAVIHVAMEQ
ncbi:hypothetical protein CROQUDRAFT_100015 [Cronartium quercuum f. sp. fusiforme G11]|uniref:Uncharacterized protein n=1 Tax=Cronartium quercuum f. sp. fusiforme G11 TaxID=708437 RepID=A0A9P6NA36_9BASI|nr:hypothetical protein CROQUDRAFT_100015 [Cronartium quercuum f. sp. fusiforme G11]